MSLAFSVLSLVLSLVDVRLNEIKRIKNMSVYVWACMGVPVFVTYVLVYTVHICVYYKNVKKGLCEKMSSRISLIWHD